MSGPRGGAKRAAIKTIEQRARLAHRPKPYWHRIDGLRGAALGFRKHAASAMSASGAWVLRYRVDGEYLEHGFAEADAAKLPANGSTVLTFEQAINGARALYSERTATSFTDATAAPYTIRDLCHDYVRRLEQRKKKFDDAENKLAAHVIPALGDRIAETVTTREFRDWLHGLAAERPRARSAMNGKVRRYREVDETDEDYARRRAATANRVWTSFRAALSLAFEDEKLASAAFQRVKPLKVGDRSVNQPDCRPILPEEMDEFLESVNAEGSDFETLVLVALYSGLRYSELGRLRVRDFDRKAGTIYVRPGKTPYDRRVHTIPEGRALLERLTAGRKPGEILLLHDVVELENGEPITKRVPWGKNHQARPMDRVRGRCPDLEGVTFKSTRDTFATWLLNAGVRLTVVSEQLGHRNVDITRKHYAQILDAMRSEATKAAERIKFVGGAEILSLDAHRTAHKA